MKSASQKTSPRQKAHAGFARALLCIAPLALAGCSVFSPIPQNRGSLIEKDDYSQLVPGTSTRNDVTDILGSPTAHATFDDNTWIYISMVTVPQPLGFPRVTKQNVLVLAFDNGGVLRRLDTLHRKNGYDVGMVGETTPTPAPRSMCSSSCWVMWDATTR